VLNCVLSGEHVPHPRYIGEWGSSWERGEEWHNGQMIKEYSRLLRTMWKRKETDLSEREVKTGRGARVGDMD
jgi:hypothetical protein